MRSVERGICPLVKSIKKCNRADRVPTDGHRYTDRLTD